MTGREGLGLVAAGLLGLVAAVAFDRRDGPSTVDEGKDGSALADGGGDA